MIRQTLDPGSPYVDVVVHGDGLVSLQFRDSRDGFTREIQGQVHSPRRLQLDRHGDFFTWSAGADADWAPDGSYLLFNSGGRIWRYPLAGGTPSALDTGFANRCNNDHGISPDGRQLVISDQSETGQSPQQPRDWQLCLWPRPPSE